MYNWSPCICLVPVDLRLPGLLQPAADRQALLHQAARQAEENGTVGKKNRPKKCSGGGDDPVPPFFLCGRLKYKGVNDQRIYFNS